jgi:hypothetical protein
MNTWHTLKCAALIASTAILAACGGSDGAASSTSTAPKEFTPWASPAMFVPEGQASVSMPLTCLDYNSLPVTSATLQITSAGDLVFSGAVGTATLAELVKVKYAEATYRYIDSRLEEGNSAAYVELQKDDTEIYAQWREDGYTNFYAQIEGEEGSHRCSLPSGSASFSLKRPLSEERLAATVLKGVNQMSKDELDGDNPFGALSNGVAYWDNHEDDTSSESAAQNAIRYFSLNLSTGVMTGSPTPSVPQTSPTNLRLALPTTTSTYGYFAEEDSEGQKYFELDIRPSIGARIGIFFDVVGNFLKPDSYLYFDN